MNTTKIKLTEINKKKGTPKDNVATDGGGRKKQGGMELLEQRAERLHTAICEKQMSKPYVSHGTERVDVKVKEINKLCNN